ncbi:MAG TPA: hypothetical protein DEO86_15735 [Colwellia sp.]|nr:hypothetical protein [Colwellia sp.]|tara:strand:- start:5402 stop:6676 length:1275 start_codon:yes stop_codon:yes gene_type:complete
MNTLINKTISMLYNIAAIDHTCLNNLSIPKLIRSLLQPLNLAFTLTKISLTNFNYQHQADLSQYKVVFVEHDTYKVITQDVLYNAAKTTVIIKNSTTFKFNSINIVSKQYLPSLLNDIEQHLFIDKVYLTLSFHGQSIKAFKKRYTEPQVVSGFRIESVRVVDAIAVKYHVQFKITHLASGVSADLFFNPINKDYNNTKAAFNPSNGLEAVSWVLKEVGSNDKALFNQTILNCNVTRIDYAFDAEVPVDRLPFRLKGSRSCKIFVDIHGNVETIQVGETGVFAKVYNKYNELAAKGYLAAKDVENKPQRSRCEVTVLPQKTSKVESYLFNDLVDDIKPFSDLSIYDEFLLKEVLTPEDYSLFKALGMFVLTQNKQATSNAAYNQLNRQLSQCEIDYSDVANNAAKRLLGSLMQDLLSAGGSHVK